jgi:diadenylate cyclase
VRVNELLSRLTIPRIGVVDVIDILIIAVVVFQTISLIRNTGAVSLIKGLTILFVATTLSGWLGLRAVNWLLERALTGILVALPVVFYPELRRTLEQLGRGQIFNHNLDLLSGEESQKLVDAIARAAKLLSESKTGALIVIEGETGLGEFVETGVTLEAKISSELFVNIFTPNTPLHDGAVVVRGDRVAAAGCFLPLSENPNISKKLGTRHRAAIGVSETSDAVVLIVSEETGTISVAFGGRLTRGLTEESLRERLQAVYKKPADRFHLWKGATESGRHG